MYRYYIIIILFSFKAFANDNWNQIRSIGLTVGKKYNVSSGTGFFVANHYIITNNHVVENCLNISVRGAVKPSLAKLVSINKEDDLALLYTEATNTDIANFRSNDNIKSDNNLIIIGYPLTNSETGNSAITYSNLIDTASNITQLNQIEFTANIEHGNSGGPLLDSSGNVIGVIRGIKKYYNEYNNITEKTPFKIVGFAVGLNIVRNFLQKNSIYTHSAVSSDFINNYNIANRARNYIVNIHCVKN